MGWDLEGEPGVACLGEKWTVLGWQSEMGEHLRAQWASVIFFSDYHLKITLIVERWKEKRGFRLS